jgi:AcrR family transcriptional regulator
VTREAILSAALAMLDEGGALTMRGLAARMGVTPMSLYHHVADRTALLVALSDQVYAEVLADPVGGIRDLLTRYHAAVGRHPQLTLEIFAEPAAFAGVSRLITERLTALLAAVTAEHVLWRDVLVDHAHGSGLALVAARGDVRQAAAMREQYAMALDRLLRSLPALPGLSQPVD